MQIRLLQNCIEDKHLHMVQPGFEPLDFRHNPRPEHREFQIFRELYELGEYGKSDILGAVSIRFKGKSLLDGNQVRRWIEDNPGYDVYVVNPFPQFAYMNKNIWQRADAIHGSDISLKGQKVFDRVGIPFDISRTGYQSNDIYSLCSYWFGTPAFWEAYLNDVIVPVLNASREQLGPELFDFLYEPSFYYGVSVNRCGSLPFLLERTVSMFLAQNKNIRAKFYPADRSRVLACCLFNFERELVSLYGDTVDRWAAEGYEGEEMDAYFRWASPMAASGWKLYFKYYPISFEGDDPRSSLPWFSQS